MESIEWMLSAEWGMSLPKGLIPECPAEVSEDEVRHRYKLLVRLLDTRIAPKLRSQAKREGYRALPDR